MPEPQITAKFIPTQRILSGVKLFDLGGGRYRLDAERLTLGSIGITDGLYRVYGRTKVSLLIEADGLSNVMGQYHDWESAVIAGGMI